MSRTELKQAFEGLRSKVLDQLRKAYEKNVRHYDIATKPLCFELGEKIWHKNHVLSNQALHFSSKLAPKYVPGLVERKLGRYTYIIKDLETGQDSKYHANDLFKD